MHATPCTFVIHNIELLVQESIENELSLRHPILHQIKHFVLHIVDNLFVFRYLEEFHYLIMLFQFFVFKVYFQFFLQVFKCCVVFKSPGLYISINQFFFRLFLIGYNFGFFLEKCRFLSFTFGILDIFGLFLFLVICQILVFLFFV